MFRSSGLAHREALRCAICDVTSIILCASVVVGTCVVLQLSDRSHWDGFGVILHFNRCLASSIALLLYIAALACCTIWLLRFLHATQWIVVRFKCYDHQICPGRCRYSSWFPLAFVILLTITYLGHLFAISVLPHYAIICRIILLRN